MNNQTKQNLRKSFPPDDLGPCDRPGDRICEYDTTYECKGGRWKSTHEYCPSDNTPTK